MDFQPNFLDSLTFLTHFSTRKMVELDLVEIRKDQVERLKRFDLSNFPVCYPEMYYKMASFQINFG